MSWCSPVKSMQEQSQKSDQTGCWRLRHTCIAAKTLQQIWTRRSQRLRGDLPWMYKVHPPFFVRAFAKTNQTKRLMKLHQGKKDQTRGKTVSKRGAKAGNGAFETHTAAPTYLSFPLPPPLFLPPQFLFLLVHELVDKKRAKDGSKQERLQKKCVLSSHPGFPSRSSFFFNISAMYNHVEWAFETKFLISL